MRRRKFITLVGGAAAAWPLGARAQQPAMPVIGFLNNGLPDALEPRVRAFRQGLNETGYVEDRNVVIEFRWAEGHYDRLSAMAAELVRRQVAVIAASPINAAIAAKSATSKIPIVFSGGVDPVKFGLVTGLAHPGGNATGVTFFSNAVGQKRLGLLHELVPNGAVIGLLVNPNNTTAEAATNELQVAAQELGHKLVVAKASTGSEIDSAFATLMQPRIGGLIIYSDGFFTSRRVQLATLAARHAIPAIYPNRDFAVAGGLMSYASDPNEAYHQMGIYTGRVLKGAKPADLPVMQPTKLELVINLNTAKAIGLTIPPRLLAIADEVIE
jgi:putative ABC transport system substrate-binding protein